MIKKLLAYQEVDSKLKGIMVNIFHNLDDAAKRYGHEGNYVMGANIAGFLKVATAMKAQGTVQKRVERLFFCSVILYTC